MSYYRRLGRQEPAAVSLSDERLARNEILFREINQRLDEMSVPWSKTTDFLCECSETSCNKIVELTNDEYERVRSHATVFVVVPGHERPEIEKKSRKRRTTCS